MSDGIRLMIVDDQELMRDGLVTILERQQGIEVVAVAGDGKSAVEQAKDIKPDVILMDVRMPIMDGVEATRLISQHLPTCRILMLTTFNDEQDIVGSLRAGAVGYVLKNIPTEALTQAIRMAHRGIVQLDPAATAKIIGHLTQEPTPDPVAAKKVMGLTEREQEVLHLVSLGATNREIADQLVISEGTVKSHISRILSHLDLRDRTQLAIFVHQNDIDLSR